MSAKDLPEMNQPGDSMAADSGTESSPNREEVAQADGKPENGAGGSETAGGDPGESVDALKQALQQKENEIGELIDRLQRLAAEYDNFRKRTSREKEKLYSDSLCDVVSRFLPVVDNLERAVSAASETGDGKSLQEGINMIFRQMTDILEKMGVKPIEAVGKTFDPELHHAVMHVEDENYGAGEIVEEFQKGYIYKDQTVIRHSMVKVAN